VCPQRRHRHRLRTPSSVSPPARTSLSCSSTNMYAAGPVGSAPLCAVAAARLPREALPPLPPRFVPTPCVCAPQIAGKIRPVIEAYTLKSPCILEIPSKAHHYVTRDTHSRPEASADSASSTPRQRQIKLGTASSPGQPWSASVSFGQPRPASASLGQSVDVFSLAGPT
jgi:hypothetical protein